MPSKAESLFEEIMAAADKTAHLRAMVNSTPPTFEEEWLDFKAGVAGPSAVLVPLTDEKIKELWSTAISGFANTGGGVLIWGIDARKKKSPTTGQEVDAASDVRLVPDPNAFKSRLMTLHHMATDPPVSGVRIEPILDPAGGGFVVCLIPESSFKPHRADWATNKPIYFRVGDDFVVAPMAFQRSMFYPRTHANFSVDMTWWDHDDLFLTFMFVLTNTGTATAHDTHIVTRVTHPWVTNSNVSGAGWEYRNGSKPTDFSADSAHPLHPNESVDILSITVLKNEPAPDSDSCVHATFIVSCRDQSQQFFRVRLHAVSTMNQRGLLTLGKFESQFDLPETISAPDTDEEG